MEEEREAERRGRCGFGGWGFKEPKSTPVDGAWLPVIRGRNGEILRFGPEWTRLGFCLRSGGRPIRARF